MGKPAARMGDMTAHGGSIVAGCPTVLIGGKPAARVGDNHVCPMCNPGTPPPPHVGGPIMPPGVPVVLIGGMPAACVGDMLMCAGTPDTIASGCPTVLIGTGGGGGGGGGGAGKAGGEARADEGKGGKGDSGKGDSGKRSEVTTKATEDEMEEGEDHFLDVRFVDKGGFPITGTRYSIKTPEGKRSEGNLVGAFKKTGVKEGDYEIELKAITKAEWSKKEARDGETVKMLVETAGIEDGTKATIEVWERNINEADKLVKKVGDFEVKGGKVTSEWHYEWTDEEETSSAESSSVDKYYEPSYYFVIKIENYQSHSPILEYRDFIEIEAEDDEGNPLRNENYRVYLSNGEIREGKLDGKGYAKIDKVPPGKWVVEFTEGGLLHEITE